MYLPRGLNDDPISSGITMSDQASKTPPTTASGAGERVDVILNHLKADGNEIHPEKIRAHFIQLWEYEDGDNLSAEDQYLTTVALFIYTTHNHMDDQSIRMGRAREYIINALRDWRAPDIQKAVTAETASDNPFKAFVEGQTPEVEEFFSWRNFMFENKKSTDKEWTFKMKKCWFAQFFIRFGRTDYIETACMFDKLPAEARKDYVNLELKNLFAKLGISCQFKYTPAGK